MIRLQNFKNLNITTKFVQLFLLIALIPLAIAIEISYSYFRTVLEQEITRSLAAVGENKTNKIESFLEEKVNATADLANMPVILDAMQRFEEAYNKDWAKSPMYLAVVQEFTPLMKYHQKSSGFDDLVLVNMNGDILFSIKDKKYEKSLYEIALHEESMLAKLFTKAMKSGKPEASDFEYEPSTKRATVFLAAPIFNGATRIGVLISQLSNEGLSKLVQNYERLGKTGETMIVSKLAGDPKYITPLRFDPNAAFTRKINLASPEGLGILKAMKDEKGMATIVDYRGNETLAVWKQLAMFRLVVIVKMDIEEVYYSANRLRSNLLIIGVILLLLVAITAVLVARSISKPIKELTAVTGVIAGGDLTARATVRAEDEIGTLAKSFNKMTDKLVEAKAAVEEQKKLLEKANHELDSFVYTASHDLRAPLRGIISFVDFLDEDYKSKLDEQGRDYIREIRDGAKRMTSLIDDLLTLSRISRIKNPYEDVDISALVNEVVKRIEFDIKKNGVDLNIQADMPVVRCDSIKMKEVFINLINNAVKFSSKNNKEQPAVKVGYVPEKDFYKFYVKDNGIGIDPQYHKQVFDIFKRLHTVEEYDGTGAGLSIVKRIVDDHGGQIWVESELGKGATFLFTIPKVLKTRT